ncbi:hypothetical protein CLOM_g10875 [Closterium sp. NIES-68]|nr:hypothetical protein CLOM_g10875 [Closterium sp. NIES-68]
MLCEQRFARPFLDAHRDYKEPIGEVPAVCATLPVALVPVAAAFENLPPCEEPTFGTRQDLATCQIERFTVEDGAIQDGVILGPPPAAHPGRVGDGSASASPCLVCGEDEDENTVLCDLCFASYHVGCLATAGEGEVHVDKDGEWVCDLCDVEEKRKGTVVVVWAEECAANRRTAIQEPGENVRLDVEQQEGDGEDGDVVLLEPDVCIGNDGADADDDVDVVVLVPREEEEEEERREGTRSGRDRRGSGGKSNGGGSNSNSNGKGNSKSSNEEPWLQNFEKRGRAGRGDGNDSNDSVADHKGHWLLQRAWLSPVGYTRVGPMFQASVPEWTGPPCVFNGAGANRDGDEDARECNRRYDDDDGARPPFGHEAKWTDAEHRAEINSWSRARSSRSAGNRRAGAHLSATTRTSDRTSDRARAAASPYSSVRMSERLLRRRCSP